MLPCESVKPDDLGWHDLMCHPWIAHVCACRMPRDTGYLCVHANPIFPSILLLQTDS